MRLIIRKTREEPLRSKLRVPLLLLLLLIVAPVLAQEAQDLDGWRAAKWDMTESDVLAAFAGEAVRLENPEHFKDEHKPEPKPKPESKPDSADRTVVSRLSLETLENKASVSELRYMTAMSELLSLVKFVKNTENRAKQVEYVSGVENRLAALDLEPPAQGNKWTLTPDELDTQTKAAGEEL